MSNDFADFLTVSAADLIHLLNQTTTHLGKPGRERVALLKLFKVGCGYVLVKVVGTRQQQVFVRPWCLISHDRLEIRIEEQRLHPPRHPGSRLAITGRETRPGTRCGRDRGTKRRWRRVERKFASSQVVEWASVQPKKLRIGMNRTKDVRVDPDRMRDDLLKYLTHLKIVLITLVVINVAPGERGLIQVPDESLLAKTE